MKLKSVTELSEGLKNIIENSKENINSNSPVECNMKSFLWPTVVNRYYGTETEEVKLLMFMQNPEQTFYILKQNIMKTKEIRAV